MRDVGICPAKQNEPSSPCAPSGSGLEAKGLQRNQPGRGWTSPAKRSVASVTRSKREAGGTQRRRMRPGTIRRTRVPTMRQEGFVLWTRDSRQRYLPTEDCHAALPRTLGATRGYQSDSSSKRPISSAVFGLHRPTGNRRETGPRGKDITRILASMATIIDALQPIRNRASVAHPNPDLLETAEAILVINSARTILHYLDLKLTAR